VAQPPVKADELTFACFEYLVHPVLLVAVQTKASGKAVVVPPASRRPELKTVTHGGAGAAVLRPRARRRRLPVHRRLVANGPAVHATIHTPRSARLLPSARRAATVMLGEHGRGQREQPERERGCGAAAPGRPGWTVPSQSFTCGLRESCREAPELSVIP